MANGSSSLEFLRDLPALPANQKPKPDDILWLDVLNPDGSYTSYKISPTRIGGVGAGLDSEGLSQENIIRPEARFFYELQAGSTIDTARIIAARDISKNPQKSIAGYSIETADFNAGGEIFNNNKNEIQTLFEEVLPSDESESLIVSQYNTQELIALSAGQKAADVNYPLDGNNNPALDLLNGDTALISFNFGENVRPNFPRSPIITAFNQTKLQVKRPGSDSFETIADVNIGYKQTAFHLFHASHSGKFEFRLKYLYQSNDSGAENYVVPSYYNAAHDIYFEFLKVEHFDFYGYGFGDLDLTGNVGFSPTTFPEVGSSGALPQRINGLAVGDAVLMTIGALANSVQNVGLDSTAGNSDFRFQYRKAGDSSWKTVKYKSDFSASGNSGNYQGTSYNGNFIDSNLFIVPSAAEGGGPGDYEFSFNFSATKHSFTQKISELFAYFVKIESSRTPQIVSGKVDTDTADQISNGNFELAPGQKGASPEYISYDLKVGEKISFVSSIGMANGRDSGNNDILLQKGLSMSVDNGSWTSLDGTGSQTIIGSKRANFNSSAKQFVFYTKHTFTAQRAGNYRFRHSVKPNTSDDGQRSYFFCFSRLIAYKNNDPATYKVGLRLNKDTANSLHRETGLTIIFPDKEVPLNKKTDEGSYTEFLSEAKLGQEFIPGESQSFEIKKPDGSLFPFVDSLTQKQPVFTTWQNMIDILNSQALQHDSIARELASRAYMKAVESSELPEQRVLRDVPASADTFGKLIINGGDDFPPDAEFTERIRYHVENPVVVFESAENANYIGAYYGKPREGGFPLVQNLNVGEWAYSITERKAYRVESTDPAMTNDLGWAVASWRLVGLNGTFRGSLPSEDLAIHSVRAVGDFYWDESVDMLRKVKSYKAGQTPAYRYEGVKIATSKDVSVLKKEIDKLAAGTSNHFNLEIYAFIDGRNVLNNTDELEGKHIISINIRNVENIPVASGKYQMKIQGFVTVDLTPNLLKNGLNNLSFTLTEEQATTISNNLGTDKTIQFEILRGGNRLAFVPVRVDVNFPSPSRFVNVTNEAAWRALGANRNANTWYFAAGFLARGTVKVSG